MNKLRNVYLEKIVLNIGAGEAGDKVNKGITLLKMISNRKPIKTKCKIRNPKWGLRPRLEIGTKVTLRGKDAEVVLNDLLEAIDKVLKRKSFSANGNFAFGVPEYIDIPKLEYDPKLGIMGLDVCVKISRPGERLARRKKEAKKLPVKQRVTKEESLAFMQEKFNVKIE